MGDIIHVHRIAEANAVMAAYLDGFRFEPRGDDKPRIYLVNPGGAFPVRLRTFGDGLSIPACSPALGLGDTAKDAIAQLYRYTQDWTRAPLSWWERRVSYRQVIEALWRTSYLDPARTACVLCGGHEPTSDWWQERGREGPCCSFGRCQVTGRVVAS